MTVPDTGTVRWRYTFCDLLTDTPLAVLPLVDADLTEVIGGEGDGSGYVSLTAAATRAQDPWTATRPRRTICYAQRLLIVGGVQVAAPVLWHGIVWGRQRKGTQIALKMSTPESYWARRLVTGDRTFAAVDDADMLREVFRDAEAVPYGSLRLRYSTTVAGVRSDRTLVGTDLRTVLAVAQSIAAAGDGMDWRIAPGIDPATGWFFKTLEAAGRIGRRGVPELRWQTAATGRALNEAVGYGTDEDGTDVANWVIGLGAGQPPGQLRSIATAQVELDSGFPLLQKALSGGNELITQDALDRHTAGALTAGLETEETITGVTVRGDRPPSMDRYGLGDEVALDLNDPLHPTPTTVLARITARRILPAQPGRNETVALELGAT